MQGAPHACGAPFFMQPDKKREGGNSALSNFYDSSHSYPAVLPPGKNYYSHQPVSICFNRPARGPLEHYSAAIDEDDLAAHEIRLVGSEEQSRAGEVVGGLTALERL